LQEAKMSVEMNGIAHIQLTVNDAERCLPFWERLCHFLAMKTLIISTPHSMAASTSFFTDRDRAEILASNPRLQTSLTAFISAGDTTGKPASITSTPISSNRRAISSFSSARKTTPGICSPSRRVTSHTSMSRGGVPAAARN
jgi:hypothetical protein